MKRVPTNAAYDRATIEAILDAAIVCHLGFVVDGQPYVVPVLHARVGDTLYLHGSTASRAFRTAGSGVPVCVSVTLVDGIVLARSVFEHSLNYRSVVVLGTASLVEDPAEKLAALRAFTEGLLPGRWAEARQPDRKELKATAVLAIPLAEASAKVRFGPPDDGASEDGALEVWAGEIPLVTRSRPPIADPLLRDGIPLPEWAARFRRPGLVEPED